MNCTGSAERALVPVLFRITHWTKSGLPVSPPGLFPPWVTQYCSSAERHDRPIGWSEENTRMDSSRPWNYLCEQAGLQKLNNWNWKWFLYNWFSTFTFAFNGFHLKKKVENESICFMNWRAEENLVVNNKETETVLFKEKSRTHNLIVRLLLNPKFRVANSLLSVF